MIIHWIYHHSLKLSFLAKGIMGLSSWLTRRGDFRLRRGDIHDGWNSIIYSCLSSTTSQSSRASIFKAEKLGGLRAYGSIRFNVLSILGVLSKISALVGGAYLFFLFFFFLVLCGISSTYMTVSFSLLTWVWEMVVWVWVSSGMEESTWR